MRTIREVTGSDLVWVQQKGQNFELRSGDEAVATLKWQGSSSAVGEAADEQWTFNREGFFRQRVTVHVPGSETNIALFHPGFWRSGGTLDLGPGRQVNLGSPSFWGTQWEWTDEVKRPLIHFKRRGFLSTDCKVEIEKEAATSPDLPLLVVLGWYLRVLASQDASAGGGA